MSSFPGIIPAVVVPFAADDAIDVDALKANVAHMLDGGIHGLVVNGTMGEAGSLSAEERQLVLDTVLAAAGGRVPVSAGVSAGSTAAACSLAEQARAGGALGVMCLPPLAYKGTTTELAAHYAAVADAAQLPVMAYNNPEASGIDIADRSTCHDPQEQGGVPILGLFLDPRLLELETGVADERAVPFRAVVAEEHGCTEPIRLDLVRSVLGAERREEHAAGPQPPVDRSKEGG